MKASLKKAIWSTDDSKFLDALLYNEPEILSFELKHIFRRVWLYVGDIKELFEGGNVIVRDIAGTSIAIARDSDNELRAFHNICPHRAASFQSGEGCYQLKHLVCPYHGWVYNFQGQLIGVPRQEKFPENFHLEDFPLQPVRLEQWRGFVFICFDQTAPPLVEFLGEIPSTLAGHRTASTQLILKKHYTVKCNWKIYHDNTLCDYHVAITHRTTLHPLQGPTRFYQYQFNKYTNLLYTPTPKAWRQHNSVLKHLSDEGQQGFFTYGIFPNLHLLAFPNGILAWLQIEPLTVDTCVVYLEVYGVPELCPSKTTLLEEFEAFMFEDISVTEQVQKGYASNFFTPGPINQLEDRIVHHQQLIRQFLIAGLQSDYEHL